MALPWFDIQAAETKVNAADGQTLNDKYRQNHDKLGSIIVGDGHSHDGSANGEGPIIQPGGMSSPLLLQGSGLDDTNLLMENSIDWQDRIIHVTGTVKWSLTSLIPNNVPGGSVDENLYYETDGTTPGFVASNTADGSYFDAMMYSGDGSSAFGNAPFIRGEASTTNAVKPVIWVDDGTITSAGDLYIRGPQAGGASQSVTWLLMVWRSVDVGGY